MSVTGEMKWGDTEPIPISQCPHWLMGTTILSWAPKGLDSKQGNCPPNEKHWGKYAKKNLKGKKKNKQMHVSCVDTPQPRKTVAGKRGWITAKKFKPSSTQVTSRSAYKHLKVREECNDTPARRGTLHVNAQQSYIKSNWSWSQVSQSTWRQIRIRCASTGRTTSHPVLQSCSSKDHPVASFLPELTVTALMLRLFVLLVLTCDLDWTLPLISNHLVF